MSEVLDFLDLPDSPLYFDEAAAPGVESLLRDAARDYGQPAAENALLRAYFLDPERLSVLVGLYRYYFYQHRLDDALLVAERTLAASGRRLGLVEDWRHLGRNQVGEAAMRSMGLLRFHLLALKASAVVLLRLARLTEAAERLAKIVEIDDRDRFGAAPLLALTHDRLAADCLATTPLAA